MKTKIILFIALVLLASCNIGQNKKPAIQVQTGDALTGTWKLLVYKTESPDGHIKYPFEKDVDGMAVFDRKNNFSFQFYDGSRSRFLKSDPYFSTNPEIRIAFLTSRTSFGKYQINADTVFLKIKAALIPNYSGTVTKYFFKIKGDTLLMISPGMLQAGDLLSEHTIWIKESKY
ncbi:MAG: lipocalin-like domain-containing protein [Bacteroidales bacterium]|nr:lipocalin-like domain-containing protein [Bacteroidales bacterium]